MNTEYAVTATWQQVIPITRADLEPLLRLMLSRIETADIAEATDGHADLVITHVEQVA